MRPSSSPPHGAPWCGLAAGRFKRAPARRLRPSPSAWWRRSCSPTRARAPRSRPSLPCCRLPMYRRSARFWDDADCVLAIGTDFDGMMTQGWTQPAPQLLAVNVDAGDAAKNYLPDLVIEADAAQVVPALAARPARPGGARPAPDRAATRGPRRAERGDPDALAFLDGVAAAVPEAGVVVRDMCIPGYWLGGFHQPATPRGLSVSARLGHARLRLSPGARRGTGRGGAGREHVRRRRVPLRARRTGDGGAGADPADGRGGRRRRLRDAALRPGPARRPTRGGRPRARTCALAAFGVRLETVDGLGADFAAALERQLALAEPSVLVARAGLRPPPNVSPRWYRQAPRRKRRRSASSGRPIRSKGARPLVFHGFRRGERADCRGSDGATGRFRARPAGVGAEGVLRPAGAARAPRHARRRRAGVRGARAPVSCQARDSPLPRDDGPPSARSGGSRASATAAMPSVSGPRRRTAGPCATTWLRCPGSAR